MMKLLWAFGLSFLLCVEAKAGEATLGAAIALTGTYSYAGAPSRDGMLIALNEVNADANSLRIRIQIEDTASEKAQAITLINRFAIRDRFVGVIGPTASPEAVAAAPAANELGLVMLTPTATSEDLIKGGKWAFKTSAAPVAMMRDLVAYAVDELHAKRAILIFARDNEGQIGQERVVKGSFADRGADVVGEESVLSSDTDFLALATKVISLRPDTIFIASPAEQAANIIIQFKQAGLPKNTHFIGTPTMGSDRTREIGGMAVEGATFAADYFVGASTKENERFVKAFEAKYNRPPDNFAALGYTTVVLMSHALRSVTDPADRQAVRAALAATKEIPVPLGTGSFGFNELRTGTYGAAIVTIRSGQFAMVR